MDFRKAEISQRLNEWLDRLAVPYHLRDKPEAAQHEAEALLRILLRYAPGQDHVPFVNRVCDLLDSRMKDRRWPTPHDMGAACASVAKEAGTDRSDDSSEDTRPEAIVGRRMTRGEPVGEGWLWGRLACELIAGRHVTREVMDRYRSGAFLARRAAYGEEAALEWEREAKDNHEIAKAVFRERNQPSQPRDVARHMPAMEFA
jgi:hypothetical protein